MSRLAWTLLFACTLLMPAVVVADQAERARLDSAFTHEIRPLLETHCFACHDAETAEAMLDLQAFERTSQVIAGHQLWESVLDRLHVGDMPPEDAAAPLADEDRQRLIAWIEAVRTFEANRNAGDPGAVLARRLSNAEYDYSIRDLTGVDIRPTATFPVDPANEAGFDNSGESLAMSPALLNKYLAAARSVVEHLVLTPTGIRFAPHPVATDTDRDKYCVNRIVAFYERQPTDIADYFFACWKAETSGAGEAGLAQLAAEEAVSEKYLRRVWSDLHDADVRFGPLAEVQRRWQELISTEDPHTARSACQDLRDYVARARKTFEPHFENLKIKEVHAGSQPFVLWKNKQYAAARRTADFSAWDRIFEKTGLKEPTEAERPAFEADCRRFCATFPDAFFISERGRDYLGKPKSQQEKGRLLSAGFHSMMGYFRDDAPLMQLILDPEQQQQLDALWQELDFVTSAPLRQYQGFLWFERTDSRFMRDPQFDFARPENVKALEADAIAELSRVYLAKAKKNGGTAVPLAAISDYFTEINRQIRWVEQTRDAAQAHHLDAVVELCGRAYRRPLADAERTELVTFYHQLRDEAELSHEEAIADVVTSILISPHFAYRWDLLNDSPEPRPLTSLELANRLSYFLWSSSPDQTLLALAADDRLREPDVLDQQVQRMLRDPRVRALAVEFGGNWLDFRRFEQHNSVDRERFPEFDAQLRQAMFEEPVRFLLDVFQHDRSVKDFLYADHTFVNAVLARHYGIPDDQLDAGQWQRVENAAQYGRGGLLPMSVFLTKNAPGLRTSPVKRGYWVVRRLLGEHIPPPPPDVPELPADESQLGERTLRETLAMHRDHASCAGCHNRIDAIGLVFEGYGPVGERRTVDLGGRRVETHAVFPDGSSRDGVNDLREYLRQRREQEFLQNLSRKLLSYALGRSLMLSDEPLLVQMQERLREGDDRFSELVQAIVTSPQFLNKRGREGASAELASTKRSNDAP
ncbi:DUF1592 domain-containing protein [Roseimaritima sediminicola]|uniref:DUF1592 domain-containing protein n=1 Tax=Roseimaritima sediminicola TaxID=2662066 RepID=UPI0013876184|nr:DUF1592 domain-containing protein [Roseimaritima sediminicola]